MEVSIELVVNRSVNRIGEP